MISGSIMLSRKFILSLAKLLIAAAWADGELKNEEINALKDLMFSFPNISEHDWMILNMYMETPVNVEEMNALLDDVLSELRTKEDKQYVITALTTLLNADGEISEEESKVLKDITAAVESKGTSILAKFSGLLEKAIVKRENNYNSGLQRENNLDDYLRNTIYFEFSSLMETAGIEINLPDDQLRKLCLAAGLMARVAWVDENLTEEERSAISQALIRDWHLSEKEALLVTALSCSKVMKGLDYFRLTRTFFESTTTSERRAFLKSLFFVANSSGKTDNLEIEEIRKIASQLLLEHSAFIDAKLSIPDEDRQGL